MRLIDADEIRIKPDFIFYGVCGTPVIRCEDLARIINDMPTIEPQKWISCDERLPDMHDEVLVTARGEVSIAWLYVDGEWRSNDMPQPMFKDIVAWMPLPEPYEKKE